MSGIDHAGLMRELEEIHDGTRTTTHRSWSDLAAALRGLYSDIMRLRDDLNRLDIAGVESDYAPPRVIVSYLDHMLDGGYRDD